MKNTVTDQDIWVIGDVQGCCDPLDTLLSRAELRADPQARLWFAGDLVNRGPKSLETLRRIMALGPRATVVLGNHDLHLLAAAAGVRPPGKSDTIDAILNAPDRDDLLDWLRQQPLAHYEYGHLMVHAGVLASWSVQKVLDLAGEAQRLLGSTHWRKVLQKMYGNEPVQWSDGLHGGKRMRVIINALTRMRLCTPDGDMDFKAKVAPGAWPDGLIPWYEVKGRATENTPVIFGHWSTLGLMVNENVICLDSGCVWGGSLTAMRLSDRTLVQVACARAQTPGK